MKSIYEQLKPGYDQLAESLRRPIADVALEDTVEFEPVGIQGVGIPPRSNNPRAV